MRAESIIEEKTVGVAGTSRSAWILKSILDLEFAPRRSLYLNFSAIRRLADESSESGWLTPELAIGIRRVPGVKRPGQKSGNWLTRNQSQELVNAASTTDLRGWREGQFLDYFWDVGCDVLRSWG